MEFINNQISMLGNISLRYRTGVFRKIMDLENQNLGISNLCIVSLYYISNRGTLCARLI